MMLNLVVFVQLRYEERIQELETRNLQLQHDVSELTSSSRPHSSQLSIQRELDSVKARHHKQVLDMEQTIDSLRQQLLRLRARELSTCVTCVVCLHFIKCCACVCQ